MSASMRSRSCHGLHRAATIAVVKHHVSEHDVVVLREQVGERPAGSHGTAVSIYNDASLVEFADDRGKTLDLLAVWAEQLNVAKP